MPENKTKELFTPLLLLRFSKTRLYVCACPRHRTRFGVAEDRWTAAERRTAAVITAAATAAAHAAPTNSDRHLYLFRGTH